MIGLLVCSHALAKNPYEIEADSLFIFSIEELTYYLLHSGKYVGNDFMCEALCQWIEMELEMKNLALKLRQILLANGSLEMFVTQIIQATSYCTMEERLLIQSQMQENERRSELDWKKVSIDRYLEQKQYARAMQGYFQMLYRAQINEDFKIEDELYGTILHNIGVCYARFFLYTQAAWCFQEGYKRNPQPHIKKAYETALEYKNFKMDFIEKTYIEEEITMQLEEWKKDYKKHGIF